MIRLTMCSSSGGRADSCSKHVEVLNKRIIEKIVRQVCYLPELYENAPSEKYEILLAHVFSYS
jgi:hypothetical protein